MSSAIRRIRSIATGLSVSAAETSEIMSNTGVIRGKRRPELILRRRELVLRHRPLEHHHQPLAPWERSDLDHVIRGT
jgi:hypothetical protein